MDVKNLIKENQKLLHKLFIQNKELASIRDEFIKYTGINKSSKTTPVIATGHQPILYYPGIIFKNYFISKIAKETEGIPINFIVDSDTAEISIPVPYQKDNNYYKKIIKINNPEGYSFSNFKPSENNVILFFQEIEENIQLLDNKNIHKAFHDYKNRFFDLFKENHHFIDTIILLRKEFEELNKIKLIDLKISGISKSIAFYQFAWYIIKNIEKFLDIYNESAEKNKKSNYQAVKFLLHEKDVYEIPFWFISNFRRYPIYLKKKNNLLSFFSENEDFTFSINTANKKEEEIVNMLKNNLILFPKAITLTLMFRIFLCDVFIHGTGGVFYDKITNDIIKDFLNLNLYPDFLVITGDIYLPLIDENVLEIDREYEERQKWLKNVSHHPSKYMDKGFANKYVEKKKQVSQQFTKEKDPEKRKGIHKKLQSIDKEMKSYFNDKIQQINNELGFYKDILKNKEVFLERKYPYFFYPEGIDFSSQLEKNLIIRLL